MGSLGSEIAFLVAEQLGYQVAWREVINLAARRAGAPEAALAAIDELGLLGINPSRQASLAYRAAVEQVMHEFAARGNVVMVGRAGQVILHELPDVLHVRITAPIELRVERIAQRCQTTAECARAQVETSDRYRANYMRRFYKIRWDDPVLYHLIINTGLVTTQLAAKWICLAVQAQEQSQPSE
jgi:cytidylate kinase